MTFLNMFSIRILRFISDTIICLSMDNAPLVFN